MHQIPWHAQKTCRLGGRLAAVARGPARRSARLSSSTPPPPDHPHPFRLSRVYISTALHLHARSLLVCSLCFGSPDLPRP